MRKGVNVEWKQGKRNRVKRGKRKAVVSKAWESENEELREKGRRGK